MRWEIQTKVFEPNFDGTDVTECAGQSSMRLDAFAALGNQIQRFRTVDTTGQEHLSRLAARAISCSIPNGYVWITNNVMQGTPDSTDCMIVLEPNGRPSNGKAGSPRIAGVRHLGG